MRTDKENNIIFFYYFEEFYDLCGNPEPVIKTSSRGLKYFDMDFTDWYKSHLYKAAKMVILDDDSTIFRKGGMVSYRTYSKKINAYRVNPLAIQIENLSRQRDLLQPRLMSGKIEVKQ